MFASAFLTTLPNLARLSTAQQVRRLSPPNGLIIVADSDSSTTNRRLLDAGTRNTRKQKRFLRLAGLRCPIILCEFLIFCEDFNFFRTISAHSLVGLQNGAMLLLGGIDLGTNWIQTGIWQLKDSEWSRIGEFSKVWKIIQKKIILVFSDRKSRICYLCKQVRLLLRIRVFGDLSTGPGRKRRTRSCRRNRKPARRTLFSRALPNEKWLLHLNFCLFSAWFFLTLPNKVFDKLLKACIFLFCSNSEFLFC